MTIQAASLTPSDKALVMMAGALDKNLKERAKTDQLYKGTVQELRAVNQAQAERIQLLDAALELEKQAHESEAAGLRGELAAAIANSASMKQVHQQEVAWLVNTYEGKIAGLEARITELLDRVANFAKAICQLAAIIFNPRIYGPQVHIPARASIRATAEDFINMRGIIHRVNTNTL